MKQVAESDGRDGRRIWYWEGYNAALEQMAQSRRYIRGLIHGIMLSLLFWYFFVR